MKSKRNKYILLTTICIFSIVLLQILTPTPSPLTKEINLIPNGKALLENPFTPFLLMFFCVYLLVIVIGLANLIFFITKKLTKKIFLTIQEKPTELPLPEEKSSKLLLLICLFVLIIYIAEISIAKLLTPSPKMSLINLTIFLNLALEITVITTILKFINPSFLIPHIKKIYLPTLLQVYTVMLPLIIGAGLINYFLLEKFGINPSLNPAIEILLLLKSKFSVLLIISQVIVVGPIAEELFFRGFIYKLLRTRYSFAPSAILVSIIFALIHGTPQDTLPLFIISMILCYVYEKTQNILSPIILHSIHNCPFPLFYRIIS
ncbi:MAG: CPBP family intramembrane metalloprotease [Candidatus Omnitrophica bacterium]|nr:CPBP family intramembrane metalloprotease [Candidatus Omnitrophota bacterium]